MIPLHGFGGTAPSPGLRLSAAAVVGLAATLGATVAMWRQSYGYVPPYVAAAALWREPPSEVSRPATVRRGWAVSAAIYGLGLVAGTAAVSGVLLG